MKKSPYVILLAVLLLTIGFYELRPLIQPGYPYFHTTLPLMAKSNVLFMTACLGGACAYLFLLPIKKIELLVVVTLGLVIDGLLTMYRLAHIMENPLEEHLYGFLDLGPGLLIVAILAIIWRLIQYSKEKQIDKVIRCLEVLGLALSMPVFLSVGALKYGPYVYDPHLYALDSLWGVQVSFILSKFLRGWQPLSLFMTAIYVYLSLFMMLAQIEVYRENEKLGIKHSTRLIPAFYFLLIGILGTFCYEFLPAVGIDLYCGWNCFPNGPWPAANLNPVPIEAPLQFVRNCMPSLHLSWILAVYYSLYRAKPIYKNIALVLVVLTALSTFSVGCHYLIDLIIAIPFTMALLAIVTPDASNKIRLIGVIFGTVTVLGWLCIFKYSITSALQNSTITLTLLVITDIVALYLAHLICSQTKKTEETQIQQPLSVESEIQQKATLSPQSQI